jgi:hypothetical protein
MVALFSKSSSFKLRKFQPYGKIKRGIVPHQWRVGWQSVVRWAGHDSPTLSGVEGAGNDFERSREVEVWRGGSRCL